MRWINFLIVLSIFTVVGCSADQEQSASNAGQDSTTTETQPSPKTLSLEVSDLEKLDNWADTAEAKARLTEQLAKVMDGITDEASADASIELFKKLGSKFAAVDRARKTMPDPSADDKKASMIALHSPNEMFNTSYSKLKESPELFEKVQDALDNAYMGIE